MKILLINPPADNIITTTQAKYIISERGLVPPLGLLYLASAVRQNTKHSVKIIDCQLDRLTVDRIKEEMILYEPDIIGISFITFMLIDCIRVAKLAKEYEKMARRKVYVIAGGPHVTIFPEETITFPFIDYALTGEAEFSFINLINSLENGSELADVPGIYYQNKGNVIKGPKHTYIEDLNSLAIPDRRLLEYKKYGNVLSGGGTMTTMMTSRGCPYQCIFCDRLGKKFRAVSAENVVREIKDCVALDIGNIFFHDDTFTINKQRVLDICRMIREKNLRIKFSLRSRVNTIDEEMIRVLKRAGCQRISFGVESGVQRILNRIKKGITLDQVEEAFKLVRKYNIISLADFMIGHPDETIDDIHHTIKFAKRIKPDYIQFSVTTPYPGTELYFEGLASGVIEKDVWREFAKNPDKGFVPPRWEENIDRQTLYSILHECYRKFYLSPSFIIENIIRIRDGAELKRKICAGFKVMTNELLTKIGSHRDGFR